MRINPLTANDFYKNSHVFQYPPGTTMVYSNLTPRTDKLSNIPKELFDGNVTFFGLQYFIKDFLINCWNHNFFNRPKSSVVYRYKRRMNSALGGNISTKHIEQLHDLGYLPICIKALPEGSQVPMKVPVLIIYNTHPDFFWLTNYLETALSAYLWKPITSATVAHHYRKLLTQYAEKTGSPKEFVAFQGHDFSCRGMSGLVDSAVSGAAHLTSFYGTDSVPAIDFVEQYYNGNCTESIIGTSVPATEHSVMCMGGLEDEVGTIRRLITEVYPKGIVSIVSDTWNFWKVIIDVAQELKPEIMQREGKVVFRPDSGDPVKIVCGDKNATDWATYDGAVTCLWDGFGGTTNVDGYKVLDEHVGLIYGDSITFDRAQKILAGLESKGFAANNITLGIGSYTYQFCTRDTFGFAVKSTYGEINGEPREIYKDPITDSGFKKSARGLLKIVQKDGKYHMIDRQPSIDSPDCCTRTVFLNGKLLIDENFEKIRNRTGMAVDS